MVCQCDGLALVFALVLVALMSQLEISCFGGTSFDS
jgi:hypothetical protein